MLDTYETEFRNDKMHRCTCEEEIKGPLNGYFQNGMN
jgi:hypothetical protein